VRLIRRVRTSVVALIPPDAGIRATLTSAGVSRVVIETEAGFETVAIGHGPEEVALSAPNNATGLFELDAQPDLRPPFEGFGVDTTWQLRMPKAANPFDFSTLFDVLFTVEYTALDSPVLRDQVTRSLDPRVAVDRAFSFCHTLPDAWFDLNNPDQSATPMRIGFRTDRGDFPPNLNSLTIGQVVLFAAGTGGQTVALTVDELSFTADDTGEVIASTGAAAPVDGIISTRRGNGTPWRGLLGRAPSGEWEISFRDNQELRTLFKDQLISDLLFVLTVEGTTPDWPN
jgi:hypothetical protein